MKEKINPSIYRKIREKNHYLATNSIIPSLLNKDFIEHHSQKKFATALLFFKRAFNVNDVNPNIYKSISNQYKAIIEDIEQHERTILPQLEKIAESLVKDYFGLDEDILFEIKIEDSNLDDLYSDEVNASDEEFANYLEIVKRNKQIDRNRFNYAFVVGGANDCTNNIYNYMHYIDELNPKLSDAYKKYIALNNFNIWVTPDGILEKKYNSKKYFYVLELDGKKQVFVYAPNFLIALNQTFLAVFSILMNNSFNSQDISYVSPWNVRIGDILWTLFKKHIKNSEHLQYFLKEISKLSDEHYEFFFKEILAGTKLSSEICSKLTSKYNRTFS